MLVRPAAPLAGLSHAVRWALKTLSVLLRGTHGAEAIQGPSCSMPLRAGDAFATAADESAGMTLSPPFSAYDNDLFFQFGAYLWASWLPALPLLLLPPAARQLLSGSSP